MITIHHPTQFAQNARQKLIMSFIYSFLGTVYAECVITSPLHSYIIRKIKIMNRVRKSIVEAQ